MLTNEEAKTRAEALFIRKENQTREGAEAMAEHQTARAAEAEKLRAARLARDEAKAQQGVGEESVAPTRRR